MISVFPQHSNKAALTFDTSDFAVTQIVIMDNVAVVVTSGGNRDQVFIFQFIKGTPKLLTRQITQGATSVTTKPNRITILITGIYAGDSPAENKTIDIQTDWNELLSNTK